MVLPTFSVVLLLLVCLPLVGVVIGALKGIAAWAEGRDSTAGARAVRYWIGVPALVLEVVAFVSGLDRAKHAVEGNGLGSESGVALPLLWAGITLWALLPPVRWTQQHAVMLRTLRTSEVSRYASTERWIRRGEAATRAMRWIGGLWDVFHGAVLLVSLASVGVVLIFRGDGASLLVVPACLAAYCLVRVNAGPETMLIQSGDKGHGVVSGLPTFMRKLDSITRKLEGAGMAFLVLATLLGLVVLASP